MISILDHRYSQLPLVFARALRQGLLEQTALSGLSDEKLDAIHSLAGC